MLSSNIYFPILLPLTKKNLNRMIDPFGNRMISFLLFCRHIGLVFTISETWKEKEAVNEVWKFSLFSGKKIWLSGTSHLFTCRLTPLAGRKRLKNYDISLFYVFQPALPFVPKENHNFTTYHKEGLSGRGEFLSQSNLFWPFVSKSLDHPFPFAKKKYPKFGKIQ